jgi:Rps23 Pro-64 3,4-dihydroxylase Tpa1-like proline 4-hydroxylase
MTSTAGPLGRIPPFSVRRDFLPPEDQAGLLAWALANQARFRPSHLGGAVYDPAVRRSLTAEGPAAAWSGPLADRLAASLPDLCAALGMKVFEPSLVDLKMIAYSDGAHFRAHIDTHTGAGRPPEGDRVLSAVYYFQGHPKGFSGGQLRLHRFGAAADAGGGADLEPEANSLVAFPSWASHEVLEVRVPSGRFEDCRFAVNCWFHRRPG